MMIRSIQPMMAVATYASRASSNANFLTQYTNFADRFYAPTRALPNLKSAGVFSYLRSTGKSGKQTGGQSHSAAFRSSSQVAAEMPVMPSMAHGDDHVDAIHDDARKDNPIQADGTRRSRIPVSETGSPKKTMAQLAPMPAVQSTDGNATRAVLGRNRAILTVFRGAGNIHHNLNGLYAA